MVLDLWSETEEPEEEWFEDGQLLASLTPLRAELLRGDRRVAYLAWLLAVQAGELDPDTPEPRVPHGLDGPSASLAALISFLRVDPDLLATAAEAGVEDAGEMERFRSWVERLPAREQQRWLLRAADNLDLALGSALLVRERRDRAAQLRAQADAMQRLLAEPDGAARLLEQLVGGPVVAFARDQPELLEQARLSLLAGIDRARAAPPPTPTEHWAVAAGYAGIEHAQLVVLNAREDAERRRAQELLEEVRRLRVDRAVFADVLGWRGSRVPITAVVADLADPRDAGTRKAVARVRRSVRDVPGRYGRGRRRSHPT